MPNYKTHLVGGFAAFSILYFCGFSTIVWAPNLACALIGSLFPDLDTKSKIQILFYRLLAIIILLLFYLKSWLNLLFLIPILIFPLIIHHRGITHKFWFIFIISCLIFNYANFLGEYAAIYFFVGALSHIILDKKF